VTIHTKITVPHQHTWDDETKQRMAFLWNSGKSAAQVAALFGISRNVVIGLAHRNKIFKVKGRGSPAGPRMARERKIRAPREGAPKVKPHNNHVGLKAKNTRKARMEAVQREASDFLAGTSPLLRTHVDDEARLTTGKELLDLGRHECRWVLNNGGPFLFCAEETGGTTYCAHHAQRAYRARDW
jgi:GcrA cell cycle regulator